MQDMYASNNTIHATLHDDAVWVSKGDAPPRRFAKPPAQLWGSRFCAGVQEYRIIAIARNSALARDAFDHARVNGARVLLGSPTLVHTRAEREDPAALIHRSMALTNSLFQLSPSAGGWHEMREVERPLYAASAELQAGAPAATVTATLAAHELMRRLRFIQPCDHDALSQVVATIRDPRWYVSSHNPSKMRRLYNYMGFRAVSGDADSQSRRELLTAAWRTQAKMPSGVSRHPRGFLWRYYYKLAASAGSKVRAELRTSMLCMRYIRSVWLDVLADGLAYVGEPLFVPEHFFEAAFADGQSKDTYSVEIAAAYRRYLADPVGAPAEGD